MAIALLQAVSMWAYRGDRVDESEIVHFAVGFLGRDLDPGWYGYGSLGMYLLFVVYALLAIPALAFGPFGNVSEYAEQVFSGGYFFIVGRYVFAVFGVLTVALYADIARKYLRAPRALVVAYVVVAVTSVDAIFYANYIRTDRLVSFFVALVLWTAVRSHEPRWLYASAVAVAGAVAAKISALPLLVFLAAIVAWRCRRGEANREQAVLSLLLGAFAMIAFQPFMSYPERVMNLLVRGSESPFRWGAATYGSMLERFRGLVDIVGNYLGLALVGLAGLPFVRGRGTSQAKRTVRLGLLLLALLLVPYLRSPELRSYWFVPAIDLLRFLALASAVGFWAWLAPRRQRLLVPKGARVALAFVAVLAIAAPGLYQYAVAVRSVLETPASNAQLAQAWLEEELLGQERIRLDRELSYVLPRIYDPQAFHTSKVISRAFIFDRWEHDYLNAVFAQYLVTDYGPRHGLGDTVGRLRALRLDLPEEADQRYELRDMRLCPVDGEDCRLVTDLVRANQLHVERADAGHLTLRSTGNNPYLVLFDDLAVPVDGSYELRFLAEQPATFRGSVYLDLGNGFAERLKTNFTAERFASVRLRAAGPDTERRLIGLLAARDVTGDGVPERDRGAFLVTSPSIYDQFRNRSTGDLDDARAAVLADIEQGYDVLLSQLLVRRFDEGSGPVIEVYRLAD
jgi:hypothetical protein